MFLHFGLLLFRHFFLGRLFNVLSFLAFSSTGILSLVSGLGSSLAGLGLALFVVLRGRLFLIWLSLGLFLRFDGALGGLAALQSLLEFFLHEAL